MFKIAYKRAFESRTYVYKYLLKTRFFSLRSITNETFGYETLNSVLTFNGK